MTFSRKSNISVNQQHNHEETAISHFPKDRRPCSAKLSIRHRPSGEDLPTDRSAKLAPHTPGAIPITTIKLFLFQMAKLEDDP